mmetsp:Transcript_20077/g.32416  ORF Transcript_20077/g.32416 Transcript_20077/m.32416 type:complete len:228 (-) Transcript_20077:284-967(-)
MVLFVHFSTVPDKPNSFQLGDPFGSHGTCAPFLVLFVLAPLPLDPYRKLNIRFKVGRYNTMPMDLFEEHEILQAFFPDSIMGIPNKSDLVEETDAFVRQSAAFTFRFEFVLISLSLDPLRQPWIFGKMMRNVTMPMLTAKHTELFKLFTPDLGLIFTKPNSILLLLISFFLFFPFFFCSIVAFILIGKRLAFEFGSFQWPTRRREGVCQGRWLLRLRRHHSRFAACR